MNNVWSKDVGKRWEAITGCEQCPTLKEIASRPDARGSSLPTTETTESVTWKFNSVRMIGGHTGIGDDRRGRKIRLDAVAKDQQAAVEQVTKAMLR